MWLDKCITEEMPFLISVKDKKNAIVFEVFGSAPVQATGEVDGRDFHFYARHSEWVCEVADREAGAEAFMRKGKWKDASFMALRDALEIIDSCLAEYLADQEEACER